MVGSHVKNFAYIFNIHLFNKDNQYICHIESLWEERTSDYANILVCEPFQIEPTQRGGINLVYIDI